MYIVKIFIETLLNINQREVRWDSPLRRITAQKSFWVHRKAQLTQLDHWRYVKTDRNPADLGTRWYIPQKVLESKLWWHGPPLLSQSPKCWPKPRIFKPNDLESRIISIISFTSQLGRYLKRTFIILQSPKLFKLSLSSSETSIWDTETQHLRGNSWKIFTK